MSLRLLHTNGASRDGAHHGDRDPIDITGVTVSDLSEITVNRDPNGVDPFAPILVTPTFSANSNTRSGFAVELADPAEKTGYRHVGNVSENYLLLPNDQVRALAVEIAMQTGMPFKESGLFWDGRKLMHTITFLGHTEAVVPGDEHGLQLVTMTSYDKSWRYRCMLGIIRFACSNGTVAGDFLASTSFKHIAAAGDPKADSWQHVVREGLGVIDHGPDDLGRFVEAMRVLKGMRMTDGRLREVWASLPTIGDSIKGRIMSRYVGHEEASLYGFYQAGTASLSKRGDKATAADVGHLDTFCSALLDLAGRQN